VQIVGYDTGSEKPPAVLLADGSGVERLALESSRTLSFSLDGRHCAGALDGEAHRPCDRPEAPYCDRHTDRWPCARCTGECSLPLETCREEHVVYLAAFAPATFKVGVTRSWRLRERLREQGADRGAHLRTVANGRVAREIEAEIAADVGDSVRVTAKIRGLHRRVDEDAWQALLVAYDPLQTLQFDDDLNLSDRPVAETLFSGTVRGVKGRILVLDNGASTAAVDLRELVGYEVTEGDPGRDLQSSLDAFGGM
jgi:hypothetical protein